MQAGSVYPSPLENPAPEQSLLDGLSGDQVIFQLQPKLVPWRGICQSQTETKHSSHLLIAL